MQTAPSLFAQKLRETRAALGVNGRMTQEQLAERLGVSVDAVSKYERSLSYIRGDLEHSLSEQLGWSREEILACRTDWERRAVEANPYRLLDKEVIDEVYGGSLETAIKAKIAFSAKHFDACPEEFAADFNRYVPMYSTFPENWETVMQGREIAAIWSLAFLMPEDEKDFMDCRFLETQISVERVQQPILPGTYFGYCPGLVVKPGSEAASLLLIASFIRYLERLARRDILFHGIGSVTVSRGGAQLSKQLGMEFLGRHKDYPEYENWVLSGWGIANSIFAHKSPFLQSAYQNAFPGD